MDAPHKTQKDSFGSIRSQPKKKLTHVISFINLYFEAGACVEYFGPLLPLKLILYHPYDIATYRDPTHVIGLGRQAEHAIMAQLAYLRGVEQLLGPQQHPVPTVTIRPRRPGPESRRQST